MTGCLIKDLMLIKNQKQFLVIIGVIGLMMLIIYDNPSFVFGYLTVMLSFLPITTLAYDDAENGAAYLFSLPVTRRGYVAEKYLFSIGFTLVTGAVVYGVVWVGCLLKRYSIQVPSHRHSCPDPVWFRKKPDRGRHRDVQPVCDLLRRGQASWGSVH